MSALDFEYRRGGIHLPSLRLWLDATAPQQGPDRVFVSHAHSDHIAAHREVILSAPTSQFLEVRLRGKRQEHVLALGEPAEFETDGCRWRITLLPAGHMLGSAMALLEADGGSLLYTGDFKLRTGLTAEPCGPRHADGLIMETTFGRPHYRFPPATEVLADVIRFCREALDAGATPVFLAYSLGKSQELLRGLADAGLQILLQEAAHEFTQIYQQFGLTFPAHDRLAGQAVAGHVVITSPGSKLLATLRQTGPVRTAVVTGWALDSSCRYRSGTDAAFPLSDHADFPELIEFVRSVAPKRVFTVHGFAAEFAWTLRDLGFDARALGGPEQMTLPLGNL
jgi:Cft2 family RNA processing exonuclease